MDKTDKKSDKASDEYIIDLTKIISILLKNKLKLIGLTSIGAIASIFIALNLTIIFTSSALVVPNDKDASNSSLASQFGGLASIAGLDTEVSQVSKKTIAKARIGSLDFFKKHLYPNILHDLVAAQSWDPENNNIIYDESLYNPETKEWLMDKPSPQQAYRSFGGSLDVVENKLTGIITISIEHISPVTAKHWVDLIIKEINNSLKEIDKQEAILALSFYEAELSKTSIQSVKQMVSALMEEQQKKLMLSNVLDEYVLKVIEPAVVPERRTRPSRAKFCVIFTLIAGLVSIILVLIQDFLIRNKESLMDY